MDNFTSMKNIFTLGLALCSLAAYPQFTDITAQLEAHNITLTSPTNGYGSGISFYDFNKDGWDDLSLSGGTAHPVFLQNNEGVLEPVDFGITNFGNARVHSLLWVDYDNDGDADLFVSRQNGPMQLWNNDGNMNFTDVAEDAGLEQGIFVYANASWADYDHDGCLDFYVTKNYSFFDYLDTTFTSQLYRNNCDGTFTDVTAESGVQLIPRTELQPVWVDVNNDGWEDLFISVDRLPFQNELFLNNQDGSFTQISESANINDNLDAMGASVADFNQDGFMDIYVGNNPIDPGNVFYQNNGDLTFTNIAPAMDLDLGVESTLSTWGALWIDYNNDTWEDLFLATMIFTGQNHPGSRLYNNDEGLSFTEISVEANINTPMTTETFTTAMGDLNNDGYYDYATGNRDPYTPRLKLNNGGDNNFLSVELQGVFANRDGIGTWIRCYVDGREFLRYTHCGENLAGQNSSKKIFGLADYTMVDSLVLDWNSGTHEVYTNVEVNQFLYLIEGASFLQPFNIAWEGELALCPGESVVLDAGEHSAYLWNTGFDERYLTVSEPGTYYVDGFNEFGLFITSDTIEVTVFPEPDFSFNVQGVSCFGAGDGSVELNVSTGPVQGILWSTGSADTLLTGLEGGIVSFEGLDFNGCAITGAVSVNEPSPLLAQGNGVDALCYGTATGMMSAQVVGGTAPYSIDWLGADPDAVAAGMYDGLVTDQNNCETDVFVIIEEPDSLWADLVTVNIGEFNDFGSALAAGQGGTPPYSYAWSNGIEGIDFIEDLLPGNYWVTVSDANGCEYTIDFVIEDPTGISDYAMQSIYAFPNPAGNFIRLAGCDGMLVNLNLHDMSGRNILTLENVNCGDQIDLNAMAAGSYILRITESGKTQTLKLIISNQQR